MVAGCYYHEFPAYQIRITNNSSDTRLVVMTNGSDKYSSLPAYSVPADGIPRTSYYAQTIYGGDMSAKAEILIYKPDCDLLSILVVQSGDFEITIDTADGVGIVELEDQIPNAAPYLEEFLCHLPGSKPANLGHR